MEKYSLDFKKAKFEGTNPGKETRKLVICFMVFFVLMAGLFVLTICLLKISALEVVGAGSSVAALITFLSKWKGRSP